MSTLNPQQMRNTSIYFREKIRSVWCKTGYVETPPSNLDLKDDGTPMCSRHYPVSRVHEDVFRKEVKRLLKLGVLKEANDSKWGATNFAKLKPKTNCVRFLSDFRDLNRQFKRTPYLMPKIREILLNLEGFQYTT